MSKTPITYSQVVTLLEEGKTRAEIRQELGLTHSEMALLFQHPKLKHKRPKIAPSFIFIDDSEEGTTTPDATEDTPLEEGTTTESESTTFPEEELTAPTSEPEVLEGEETPFEEPTSPGSWAE